VKHLKGSGKGTEKLMCGIAGFITRSSSNASVRIPAVLQSLEHRGPDDQGWLLYSRGDVRLGREWPAGDPACEVALLHRRLSILDLSAGGWQPMGREERYYVVYNGEIYNYLELRKELERAGCRFHSQSDTEVLLAAYEQWGVGALPRFIGMFAFALLDVERRTVLLARDFFGIKPLYYSTSSACLSFSSELNTLFKLADVKRHVNPHNLLLYLRHGLSDQGSSTLLDGYQQLPAAHYIEISIDDPTSGIPRCYWRPELLPAAKISFDEAAEQLRGLFLESIRLHLRSDVPVGTALSGGIDSSSIVACMRKVVPELEIHAISYVAEDSILSEENWIDIVGKAAGARVHKVRAQPSDLVRDLDALLRAQQEPFGGTSVYAQYRVFQLAHQRGIKVMLDGQGADELLGGYRYCLSARFASLIRQQRFSDAFHLLSGASQSPNADALWLLLCSADYLLPRSLQAPLRAVVAKQLTPRWVRASWFRKQGIDSCHVNYCRSPEVLRQTLLRILFVTSLPHLLRYEDRNSMAFSVESRVPFLTPKLAEFMLSIPEEHIIARNGTTKAVFRHAMRGIVPDCILDRRDKIGFATPEREWLKAVDSWVQSTLASEAAASLPFLDLRSMRGEWNAISNGRQAFDNRVWRWLNIIRWSQELHLDYGWA
jgi:asparagine synthase (glutamine-hydrolysing)